MFFKLLMCHYTVSEHTTVSINLHNAFTHIYMQMMIIDTTILCIFNSVASKGFLLVVYTPSSTHSYTCTHMNT